MFFATSGNHKKRRKRALYNNNFRRQIFCSAQTQSSGSPKEVVYTLLQYVYPKQQTHLAAKPPILCRMDYPCTLPNPFVPCGTFFKERRRRRCRQIAAIFVAANVSVTGVQRIDTSTILFVRIRTVLISCWLCVAEIFIRVRRPQPKVCAGMRRSVAYHEQHQLHLTNRSAVS
jgi:hypothetical protein